MLSTERERAYGAVEALVGRTPLIEVAYPGLPNGNRVLAKLETANPTGSHHDRQFVGLLKAAEEAGRIVPGVTPLVETTSGSSGVSLGWTARLLGYHSTVIAPEELPRGRREAIREAIDGLILVPGGLAGVAEAMRGYLARDREYVPDPARRHYCVNHTRDERAADSLGPIASEAVDQARAQGLPTPTDFVGVCGSGTSLLGVGRVARSLGLRVHAWEPWASGVAYDLQGPRSYWGIYGIEPGTVPHRIWGASAGGVDFPHLRLAIPLLDSRIKLVVDAQQLQTAQASGLPPRGDIDRLPRWDRPPTWHLGVGPTSLGGLAVARLRAEHERGRTYLVIFHDASTRHLEKSP